MQEIPLVVNNADPVCVSICGNADVEFLFHHIVLQRMEGGCRRSRELSAKESVVPVVDGCHLTAGSHENHLQGRLADTVHGIQRNLQPRIPNRLHIHRINNIVQIFIQRIDFPDITFLFARFVFCFLYIFRLQISDIIFDILRLYLVRIPASGSKHFNPVINSRIVAGSNHHSIGKLMLHHMEHHQRSGGGFVNQVYVDVSCCKYHGRPLHGLFGKKSPVISHNNALLRHSFTFHFVYQSL